MQVTKAISGYNLADTEIKIRAYKLKNRKDNNPVG